MPTDKESVTFLYTIIKQLETKHVNWKIIAIQNNISNDHAARMRFHRLRQAFEGTTPRKMGPRRIKTPTSKKAKFDKMGDRIRGEASDDEEPGLGNNRGKMLIDPDLEDDDLEKYRRLKELIKQELMLGTAIKPEAVTAAQLYGIGSGIGSTPSVSSPSVKVENSDFNQIANHFPGTATELSTPAPEDMYSPTPNIQSEPVNSFSSHELGNWSPNDDTAIVDIARSSYLPAIVQPTTSYPAFETLPAINEGLSSGLSSLPGSPTNGLLEFYPTTHPQPYFSTLASSQLYSVADPSDANEQDNPADQVVPNESGEVAESESRSKSP